MSALGDYADRLSQLAGTIQHAAGSVGRRATAPVSSAAGPFTRAMLETPLGDLIREIDPSEIGLFTLVSQGSAPVNSAATLEDLTASVNAAQKKAEIARVTLPIATPLRKPPPGMYRKEGGLRATEHDPEVYVKAAIKYLDRYQSIRPMPRFVEKAEFILERVMAMRESIMELSEKLKELSDPALSGVSESPQTRIKAEEARISDIQAKIAELKKQKENLVSRKRTGSRFGSKLMPQSKAKPPDPRLAAPVSPPDAQEEDFWNTPGAPARTLHFTGDLLTDERLDVSNMDHLMSSPLVQAPVYPRGGRQSRAMQFTVRESLAPNGTSQEMLDSAEPSDGMSGADDDDEGEEERTIIIEKRSPSLTGSTNQSQDTIEPESASMVMDPDQSNEHITKARFKITTELEDIVAKIWLCMGDTIMPGHSFDVSGSGKNKPPYAKETIKYLQSLSTQSPSVDSPTASSLSSFTVTQGGSSQPSAQQVLTAQILLALLSASPSYSMSLNALKDVLSKGEAVGSVTRPIYACVAKRLLKIERGGGEQVVKFAV